MPAQPFCEPSCLIRSICFKALRPETGCRALLRRTAYPAAGSAQKQRSLLPAQRQCY
ncbi:hypothetical protein EVA_16517 [gut metagenome]|uniref:Uncharacterized protein n=1 Tax=gut metagenome TaxID=749906 RepID=J9G0P2_9ZZZZ